MINSSYLVLPTLGQRSWFTQSVAVVGASVIIALCAFISIPLPFTPVPIVAQAHVILFFSVLLGSRKASAAVVLYLMQGMMGLPVFAGGKAGLLVLAGPTGGYLLGYLIAAWITGWIAEHLKEKTAVKALFAMLVGNGVIFACGALWLSHFVGWHGAWMLGVLPFLIGDAFKLLLATRGLKACRWISPC